MKRPRGKKRSNLGINGQPVLVDGEPFRTVKDAAKALSRAPSTVSQAANRGCITADIPVKRITRAEYERLVGAESEQQ